MMCCTYTVGAQRTAMGDEAGALVDARLLLRRVALLVDRVVAARQAVAEAVLVGAQRFAVVVASDL